MEESLYEIMGEYFKDFLKKKETVPEIIVKDSFPIVWFGNMRRFLHSQIKVVTMGLNPSNNEFPGENPELRFSGAREAYEQRKMGRVCDSLNGYFDCKRFPYWEWFIAYERVLGFMPFDATYGGIKSRCPKAENYAVHIDFFSAIATNPTYSHLSNYQKKLLLRVDLYEKLFAYLTENWDNPVIVLFSTSKNEICAKVGLNNQNKFYEKRDYKNDLKVEAYKLNNKIYIWGKPNIKPFQGVKDAILKESLQEICHLIGII